MNKRNLKYLSQSVLLDERGLPFVFSATILMIFIIVASFLVWSNYVVINSKITVEAHLDQSRDAYTYRLELPMTLGSAQGQNVTIKSLNPEDLRSHMGTLNIESIQERQSGSIFEAVVVSPGEISEFLGEDVEIEIITSSKTLLSQLLGPVYNMKMKAFN